MPLPSCKGGIGSSNNRYTSGDDVGLTLIQKGITINVQLTRKLGVGHMSVIAGMVYFSVGKFAEAFRAFNEAMETADRNNDNEAYCTAAGHRAVALCCEKDLPLVQKRQAIVDLITLDRQHKPKLPDLRRQIHFLTIVVNKGEPIDNEPGNTPVPVQPDA